MKGTPDHITPAEARVLDRILPGAVFTPLAADGSGRRFLRDGSGRLAVLPDRENPKGLAESRSFWHIGRHLGGCGVPVPRLYQYDPESGIVIAEDLGDLLLHDLVRAEGPDSLRVRRIYHRVVEELARMQVAAADGFDPGWCWQSGYYDRRVMIEFESRYFLNEFVAGEMGIAAVPAVEAELRLLAEGAAAAGADFFLHRDFQSRNIMVVGEEVYFIDFQGGRLGPSGYDLASLLIDPYAGLDRGLACDLFDHYLEAVSGLARIDLPLFRRAYYHLSLQRNLQVLAAFAKLANRDGKTRFRAYMARALEHLVFLLDRGKEAFPALKELVDRLSAAFNEAVLCRDRQDKEYE